MKNRTLKSAAFLIAGALLLQGPALPVFAGEVSGEEAVTGISYYLSGYYSELSESDADEVNTTELLATPVSIPTNIAIVNVNDFLNIREKPGTEYNIIGHLPRNAYCIVHEVKDGWAKMTSGNVEGYVSTDYLFMGEEGYQKAEETASLIATVTAGSVNLRTEPSTASSDTIITQVTRGEELEVLEEAIINKDDPEATIWVKVMLDNTEGYITKQYVDVAYSWPKAVKMDPAAVTASSLRTNIVTTAKKYIGLKYVWGGNSLVTGTDCSGFVIQIYKACGINTSNIPRQSTAMAASSSGRTVSYSQIQPGDVVFYGNSAGVVDHVAIYIGNGQVIHESGRKSGCKISNINYRTVLKIKNFLD